MYWDHEPSGLPPSSSSGILPDFEEEDENEDEDDSDGLLMGCARA